MSKYIPDINNITDYADDVFERKKSGGTGKAILSFFLGVIIGLVGFFGGIFAAGKLVLSQKVGDTVDQIDGFVAEDLHALVFGTDAEHSGFINAAYAERTLEELFGDLGKAAGDIVGGTGTINSLNEILPIISDKVVAITDGLTDAIGIPIDNETLMTTPLSGIGDFFLDTLQTAKAGDILTKFAEGELNPLMMYFCYGEEGVDYTIDEETGEITMVEGHEALTIQGLFGADFTAQLQNIPLANIIDDGTTTDPIMLELLYGSENRYTKNEDGTFKEMNQVVYTAEEGKFYDDKNEEVTTVPTAENGVYTITVDEETQYVKLVDEKCLVYTDLACESPLLYKKTTLNTLDNVGDIINGIYLEDFISADGNAVLETLIYDADGKPRKISDLSGENGANIIKEIKLADILDPGDSPILKSLVYVNGDTTNPRTLGNLSNGEATDIINGLKLSDVITEDRNNEIIMFLLHGKKGVTYTIVDNQIVYAQRRVAISDSKLYDQYGEEISGATLNGTDSYSLNGVTYYLQSESDNIYKVYSDSACTTEVKYGPTTIGDMSGNSNPINNITKVLTLQEIMGDDVSNNTFLKHLADKTIDELPTALNNLTIQAVFEDEVYKKDENGDFIEDADGNKVLNGVWHYLLVNPETGLEEDYKLTNMGTLMSNMVKNVHDASLYDLKSDGIVEFESDTLDTYIAFNIYDPQPSVDNATQSKQKIGHLSVNELLDYFTILNTSSNLNGS